MERKEGSGRLSAAALAIYFAAVLIAAAAQSSSLWELFPFGVKPSAVLSTVCAAAYFYGSATGAVVGILGGVVTDALGGAGVSMLALLYMLLGYFLGAYTADKRQLRSSGRAGGWSVALAVGSGCGIVITLLGLFINAGRPNILLSLWHIALPEAVSTYLLGWLVGACHLGIQALKANRDSRGERT